MTYRDHGDGKRQVGHLLARRGDVRHPRGGRSGGPHGPTAGPRSAGADHIVGLLNLRGQVISAIDLRRRLQFLRRGSRERPQAARARRLRQPDLPGPRRDRGCPRAASQGLGAASRHPHASCRDFGASAFAPSRVTWSSAGLMALAADDERPFLGWRSS